MIWKITFTTLGDLPWMFQFLLRTCVSAWWELCHCKEWRVPIYTFCGSLETILRHHGILLISNIDQYNMSHVMRNHFYVRTAKAQIIWLLQNNLGNSKSSGPEVLFWIISSSNYWEVDRKIFLAHRIRIPEILPWDRKFLSYPCYLTQDVE